jgi:hypothetical protein
LYYVSFRRIVFWERLRELPGNLDTAKALGLPIPAAAGAGAHGT